jgi:threonine dehydrogenase-like Zn-dependent dehydrogenase
MSTKSMWARQLVGPENFAEVDAPAPDARSLAPGQVLVRLITGGICGSDLPHFKGSTIASQTIESGPVPHPVGSPLHEIVAEVVASEDPDVRPGAVVVGWASLSNGLSEYVVTDGEGLFEYDQRLSPDVAVMLQPLACVIAASRRVPGVAGSHAAVIGQGPIGVLFSHVLKNSGVRTLTAVDRVDRSDVTELFGIDNFVHDTSARWSASLTKESERPNVIFETVGHQVSTMRDAVNALAMQGHIFYFGIPDDAIYPFPMEQFLRKDASLTSGLTRNRRSALAVADGYLKEHPELTSAYITDQFKLDDVQGAFDLAVRPAVGRLKVIINAGDWA